jgi:hypothetical protein
LPCNPTTLERLTIDPDRRRIIPRAVACQAGVVDEDVEIAGFLDKSRGLLGVADIGLEGSPPDLRGDRLGLVGAGAEADDDLRAASREFDRDRAPDPTRSAGDERELALERTERPRSGAGKAGTSAPGRLRRAYAAWHRQAIASSIRSSELRSLTEIAFTLRSMRLTSPERTLPGPTSTNVRTPSLTRPEAACVNRTGAVS